MLTDDAIGEGGAAAGTVASGGDTTESTAAVGTEGSTVATVVTTPLDAGSLDDLTSLGDAPPVVMTSTGVVVPVLGRSDAGLVVNTPCGNPGEIVWGQPVGPVDVVLDAGHGGDEPGARGPNGETEAEVNLDVARRTAALLERQGVSVALTRTADYRITISNRAAIADRLGARAFVSIHHNSPTPTGENEAGIPGTEVYPKLNMPEAERLGGLVYGEVVASLSQFDVDWAAARNAGVLQVINSEGGNSYGIVRRPSVPSVLVELAYLSNPPEALVIGTAEYRQAAAAALAQGINRFLTTEDPGTGFISEPRLSDPSPETGGSDGCIDPPLE
ncbi:MAG: N-acetylmuramoyl-L-alanine amidase family protein [Acidimicrobiales bacterium]